MNTDGPGRFRCRFSATSDRPRLILRLPVKAREAGLPLRLEARIAERYTLGTTMIRLHLLLAFVVAVGFARASSAAAQTQWTEYRIAGGDYRIEFPAPPKEVVKKLPSGIPTYSATVKPDDDTYFSVSASPIASSMLSKPTEILLDIARDAQLRGTKGTLREEERLTVGDAPARRLIIDASRFVLYVLLVVKGNQFYQVLYVSASGHESQADMLHFLGSFAALPK
jgi:hypothetical protein